MKVKINNPFYYIDEGYTVTENYNETLDSANIRISQLTSRIENLEPLDRADIYKDDGTLDRTFCIDTWTETQTSINPAIYDYEISLVSETKILEGIVLPNRAITIPRGQSAKKIWYYLSQYLTMYGDSSWSFAARVQTKFNSIDCPEFQWNGPTLREVLTDLMMVADCIPIMRNNVIDYIDIGTTTGTMPTAGVNYIQRSMSLENYVSELRMDMQNVMQTSTANVNNVVSAVEYLSLISNSGIVTTENMILKTQFPILNIKKLWLYTYKANRTYLVTPAIDDHFVSVKTDMTEYIKEYKEYQTLKTLYKIGQFPSGGHFYDYQNFCIYFNRGSNVIDGFSRLTKVNELFSTQINVLMLLRFLANDETGFNYNTSYINKSSTGNDTNLYYSTFFKIEYETLADSVFSSSKTIMPKHNRVIVDNQTNSWVDAWNQGFMEYQKANRLGNENLMINQRCITETPIEIGQVYDNDNIVYQTTKQYYTNHTEVNAYATKNYVLQNYFTGVKSKIRTWVNAQDEALIRHELYKTYCEFSFSNDNQLSWNPYLLNPLTSYTASPIKYVALKTIDSTLEEREYILNCITRAIGNSVILSAGFDDNYYVGKSIFSDSEGLSSSDIELNEDKDSSNYSHAKKLPQIKSDSITDYGGIPLMDLSYTDSLGNFDEVYIRFASGLKYYGLASGVDTSFIFDDDVTITDQTLIPPVMFGFFTNPKVGTSSAGVGAYLDDIKITLSDQNVYKDNREIYKASLQFEYCVDTLDIYTTKEFIKRNQAISTQNNSTPAIYVSDTYTRELEDASNLTLTGCTLSFNSNEITINDSVQYSGKALYIAAGTNIMLGMKLPTNFNGKFYLNLKRNRLD